MLFLLASVWLLLQLFRTRLNTLFASLSTHTRLHLSPCSLHLSTNSPSLLRLPAALVDRLPRLQRHGRGKNNWVEQSRRLGAFWDLGALAAVAGAAVAQVVLLYAAGKALRALWAVLNGTTGATGAAAQLVKRAPVDLSPLPSAPSGGTAADDLLLRPLIPSLSSLPLLALALVVSQGYHELGHALAAACESIPLDSFGLHLFFLVLPTFYVALSSSPSSLPLTTSTPFSAASPHTDLRIAAAGIWHNMLLVAGAWAFAEQGGGWGLSLLAALGGMERREEGVMTSPLASHLLRGTLITHLDDLELDASSATGGSTAKAWGKFLHASPRGGGEDAYKNLGWCLEEGMFAEAKEGEECCLAEEEMAPRFCFKASSRSSPLHACLNPLPYLPPFPSSVTSAGGSPPARCIDSSSCASSHPGTVCARIADEEKVLRLGVRGDGGVGERKTVLWQGEREEVWRQVAVTDFAPRYWFLPLGFEQTLERFLAAIISLSLSLIFFNLLPLPHLDGSHILSALLSSLSSLDSSVLPLTSPHPPPTRFSPDGLLAASLRQLARIDWVRTAADRREKAERWARQWTLGVGAVAFGATVLVEVGIWLRR
ncbi:hypothetical protein JCM6882_001609 [Rhodosporidiobolus microsporus]